MVESGKPVRTGTGWLRGLCSLGAVGAEHMPLHAATNKHIIQAKQKELAKLLRYGVYTEVSREDMWGGGVPTTL